MKKLTIENLKKLIKEEMDAPEPTWNGVRIWEVWELPRSPGNEPIGYVVSGSEKDAMLRAKDKYGNLLMKVILVPASAVRKRLKELETKQARINQTIQDISVALQQFSVAGSGNIVRSGSGKIYKRR